MFAQKVMELVQDARKHQTELTKQKLLKIIKKEINGESHDVYRT